MRSYTNDFKIKTVQAVVKEGKKITDVAQSLGIQYTLISKWKKRYLDGELSETLKIPTTHEMLRLQGQLEAVTKDRDKYRRLLNIMLEEDAAQ
jgi:transposase-like protein